MKKKVPVALSGEGVKKANRNQQPTKYKLDKEKERKIEKGKKPKPTQKLHLRKE